MRLLALLLLLPWHLAANAAWHHEERDIMGTRISIDLSHEQTSQAAQCSERVFAEMHRIDAHLSTYRDDSALSRINDRAASQAVEIDAETRYLIERSIHFSEISGGAFDITYASVGYAYDYRERRQPSDAVVSAKLPGIDYRHLVFEGERLRFLDHRVRIDLGGIAKGYAVDRAIDILRRCGITNAMVSAGGDSRILGDRDGRPWIIGIRHPRDPDGIALRLPLGDSAISTSGDYERYFIADGKRIHHIIDPDTGRSADRSWSATVIGPDALATDALSTTIFILGAQAGLALIEGLDGFDAIIIDNGGAVHYSSGLQAPVNSQPVNSQQ